MMLGNEPICIDCEYKFQQSRYMQFSQNAAMLNMLDREMTNSVGMPHLSNQIKIPPAPIPPIHYNSQSVTVSGGTVGAVNFGNVHDIQVNVESLTKNGEVGVADTLAKLTNAILDSAQLSDGPKNELLEHVAFVSGQASAPPDQRKPGIVKTMLATIKDAAVAVTSVSGAWTAAEPILHAHFGI